MLVYDSNSFDNNDFVVQLLFNPEFKIKKSAWLQLAF